VEANPLEGKVSNLQEEASRLLKEVQDLSALEELRIRFLGKKGLITQLLKELGGLPAEQRPVLGRLANELKENFLKELSKKKDELLASEKDVTLVDITLPGRAPLRGGYHPITLALNEIVEIFVRMGFEVVEGPNVELDYYNFEALNIPKDHPARDMQATFFVSDNVVLRTHTSPMQVRTMEKQSPPVAVIAPGKVYRRDSDVSHTPMFHQVEGLLVDKGVSFADLKGTLILFARELFGSDTRLRFRPSFFPFTEPSAEVDLECVICRGKGCRTCKNTGWLEILGSGMVHPSLYGFVGYDPKEVTGFAFGLGVERIAMLKYGIDDIQLFYKNDLRFLTQFFL